MIFGKTITDFVTGTKNIAELLETEVPITNLVIWRTNGQFALGGSDASQNNYGLLVGDDDIPTVLKFDCKDDAVHNLYITAFGAGEHVLHIFAY
jgi:hypothetical protein